MMQQVPPQGFSQMPGAPANPQLYQQQMANQQAIVEQFQNFGVSGPKGSGLSKEEKNKFPSLYVSNLPRENFFDLDFYKFFTSKGYKLKNAKVVLHKKTSKPLGYGYLQFYNKDDAEKCL